MLEQAIANGVACQFVNNRYLSGLPQLIGNGSDFLMDVGFYSAVHSNHYCWFYRRGISYSDRYDFSLIELDQNLDDYFPGSEFLPLYVRFAASAPHIESNAMLLDRGFDLLDSEQEGYDQITWGLFEDNVAGKAWDDTGDYNFVNSFLRSDFKESYTYGGAAAPAPILQAKPSLILGSPSWRYGEETADDADTLGDALSFSEEEIQGGSFESYGERLSAAEERMRSLSEAEMVKTSAAAKAFGHLDETTPPHAAGVVLPVFTDVRLIPASLIKANSTDRNPEFMMFLIEYFGHPSYPAVPSDIRERYAYFISAIERFDDNASGFRTGWLTFDAWRASWMAGPDGVPGNADDRQDPCHVSGRRRRRRRRRIQSWPTDFALMRLLLPCLALVLSCSGDVYTLRSGTGSGSLLESLDAREILRDTIEMNGVQGELAVHHTTLCWEEVRAQVKRLLGCPVLERNRNSLLIEDRHGKQLTRHYLFATSADKHPIIFSITAPERILTAKVHEWPDAFPRPHSRPPQARDASNQAAGGLSDLYHAIPAADCRPRL